MLGLGNSGKTTLLYREKVSTPNPYDSLCGGRTDR
jgi:hypothetical protein